MLANRQNHLWFTLMLGVGLLSGCEDEPAELETMFPDGPYLSVTVEQEDGAWSRDCITECCDFPDDGIAVLHLDLTNWVLAPLEECGDELQCGPVVISVFDAYGRDFEIETVEPTVAINVQDIAATQDAPLDPLDPSAYRWQFFTQVVPREPVTYPLGFASVILEMRDEEARRQRDFNLCVSEEGHFHVYAEISPTTAPGEYVMRAAFDDVEVVCEISVVTNDEGLSEITWFVDPCSPADAASFYLDHIDASPDAPAGFRKVMLSPREAVERASLEVSRDGEILVEGSLEVAGEFTSPAGEECTIVPCQIAESLGLTL